MSGSVVRDPFERLVVDWLDEVAGLGAPDYLADALRGIERVRQRPAWLSPGRWLPMRILTLSRVVTPRWVPYVVALGLLVLLVAAIALAVGSQRRLPAPFGLAATGALVLDAKGELVAIDAHAATPTTIVGGGERAFGATVSRDGLRVVYWSTDTPRPTDAWRQSTPATLWIADVDGRNARRLRVDRFDTFELYPAVSWSPDSRRVAFSTARGELCVVWVDGTALGRVGDSDVGRCCAAWSPDGSLLAFVTGDPAAVAQPGGAQQVHVARPDGSGETRVSQAAVTLPQVDWSAEGPAVAYTVGSGDIAVAKLGPGGWVETIVAQALGSEIFFPRWSNDGHRLAYWQADTLRLINRDGSGGRSLVADHWVNVATPCWSPDDRIVVGFRTDTRGAFVEFSDSAFAVMFDIESGRQTAEVPVPGISGILACSWQRLAP